MKQKNNQKMVKKELELAHKKKYNQTMKYTRYLYIRYFLALLLFSNIFWLISLALVSNFLMVVPMFMVMFIFVTYFTMLKLQNNPDVSVRPISNLLKVNIIITTLEIISLWINIEFIFPYIQSSMRNQVIMTVILVLSIACSFLSIRHMIRIEKKEDKISKRLIEFKNYI